MSVSATSLPGRAARWLLRALGWSLQAEYPGVDKYVLVVAPHTSNWDFPLGILAAWALGLEAHWMGKHTLFRRPFGWLFRGLGGIPVRRGEPGSLSRQMARRFAQPGRLVLGIAPEGTRSHTDHWKSGFWHIARTSGVPIVLAYLDYGRKEAGLGGAFMPGDDIEADFERIRTWYRGRRGKNPAQESEIRVRNGPTGSAPPA